MIAEPDRIAAARLLLDQLGVTLDDLNHPDSVTSAQMSSVPTLAEYLPHVIAAAGPGANRTYGSYWQRMLTAWGDRRLDQITASDIEAMQHAAASTARTRRNGRHGRHAGEHVIAAARAIYTRAIADNLIAPGTSPAHRIAKPRRLPSTRRALTAHELDQINTAARTSGNDVILDALLLRLHTETACRRGGALALRLADLDTDNCLVQLREKGSTIRWQPISPALTASLAAHAASRAALLPTDRLLRYRDGRALTSRRYDHLWRRLGHQLPWVAAHGITTHWLRHTTLTWVERHHGYGIARAYAGHTDNTGPATTTYIKADLQAVATALAAMTGQPHPLAHP
ncbi:site-specific integrase [Pseudonocardia sp. DSM 110487]|uniref:tyrosine-type recombinase/integrase n=1 Tax=Pseudonocardia sp. DSM 110487 TaxID=2865833 RepID=UPI001C6A5860|nr:site-specific integrase [Pseudonocardia sp. DSM 110487]QYN33534.1 site-specific integrase [Pseudonocardia sp. DSM 110487]